MYLWVIVIDFNLCILYIIVIRVISISIFIILNNLFYLRRDIIKYFF